MIETQQQLTEDAIRRGYTPGAVVRTSAGQEVQLTSYPWFEGAGDDQVALIMARGQVGDPMSNMEMVYLSIMQFVRDDGL